MITLEVEFDLGDLVADLDRLEGAFDDQVDDALVRVSEAVAASARAGHTFTNRTTDLERSIRALDTFGRASDGTLVGGVIADMPYASYVELHRNNFAFLAPAFERVRGAAGQVLDEALGRAARAAGWV